VIVSPTKTHALVARQAQVQYAALCRLARKDCAIFNALCLRDEESGRPIKNAPFHENWHDVASETRNMLIWAHPESGKTQQFAIGRIIWLLGNNPRRRYAILSDTEEQGKKCISAIKGHIESNPVVKDIFPGLRRGELWRDNAITIERPYGIKDPSVQAFGTDGGRIQGSRLDGLVIDDILTEKNTRTPYQRDKLDQWVRSSAFSRLGHWAWIVYLANAWHPDDQAHRLERLGWWAKRYAVLDEEGKPTWPERWPMDRIEFVKNERYGPLEFARQMMCQARDDSAARFQKKWIDKCLSRGVRKQLAYALRIVPPGYSVYTGVDLATGKHKDRGDHTCLFTICIHPDGSREVLDIQAGRWQGPEIVNRIVDVHTRYQSIVIVENNAAQEYILQFARQASAVPVQPLTTGANKHNIQFGVESIATEMYNAKWIIPCDRSEAGHFMAHDEVEKWIGEMLYYDPHTHTGDRLMASWLAREGSRKKKQLIEHGRVDLLSR
jgi:hypothetical protein